MIARALHYRSGEIEYFSSFCGKGIDSGMVFILAGHSEHVARARINESVPFQKKNIRFVTVIDLFKCLKQIK